VEKKPKVIFKETARIAIRKIACFIEERGYPETAEKFTDKLFEFGNSLAGFPGAYIVCKQKRLALKQMHCAVFHENYIFVYKLVKNSLIIYNVIHTKTNPASHTV
jgi:plasmid stabilization system protein ParE